MFPIASQGSTLGTIDAIDHIFPSGGGTYDGVLSDGSDDAWIVFAATAGDNLQIDVGVITQCRDAVLLEDTTDGNFAVGDILDVTSFNNDQVGNGTDLTVLAQDYDFCSSGNLDFVATYTGQYAIAITGYGDSECCDYSVTLSGNAGSVAAAAAAPATAVPTISIYGLMLTTLGLLLIATRRLSRKVKAK
jgi:hypothetical protein